MIEWDEKYSCGIEEIDDQHKKLFFFIGELEGDLRDKKYIKLGHILNYLTQYAKGHFGFEETCMTERHCPVAAKNKKAHEGFLEAMERFKERYKTEGESDALAQEIHQMAEDWLVSHICNVDTHLKDCQKVFET